jgi:hypothetical protein
VFGWRTFVESSGSTCYGDGFCTSELKSKLDQLGIEINSLDTKMEK